MTPAASQWRRPLGGAPNDASAHGIVTSRAMTSYALAGSMNVANTARVTASATQSGSMRRHRANAASTVSDMSSASDRPTSLHAGIPAITAARATSHGNSGGYSAGTDPTSPTALGGAA